MQFVNLGGAVDPRRQCQVNFHSNSKTHKIVSSHRSCICTIKLKDHEKKKKKETRTADF